MHILLAAPHHLHYADSLARACKDLPDCRVTLVEHGWTASAPRQSWLGWQAAWRRWRISRRLTQQALSSGVDLLLCLDPLCLTPGDAARLRPRLRLAAWSLEADSWRTWPSELRGAYHRLFVADPGARGQTGLEYLPPGFDPTVFQPRAPAPELPTSDLLWIGSGYDSLLPRLNAVAKLCEQTGRQFHALGYLHPSPMRELELARTFPYLHRSLRDNARVPPGMFNRLYAQTRAILLLQPDEAPQLSVMRWLLQACASGRPVLSDAHDLPEDYLRAGLDFTMIAPDQVASLTPILDALPPWSDAAPPAAPAERLAAVHGYTARLRELLARLG